MRADERPLDLRPWLYTIAHNAALNALRDRTVDDTLEHEIDGVERPEQDFERREGLHDVVAPVGALPGRQRDALVLRELEGRSCDEIALKPGVSDGAVRQLLNRARNTLRAGVTAVTPYRLLARIPEGADEPIVSRIAELIAVGTGAGAVGTGAGAVTTKVAATALVTGAVVGGVAAVPEDGRSGPPPAEAAVSEAREQARTAVA
ncbi:MAG: sigma-70 family RNA polymerase sigma factor, partial [Actinomycetota bacterium]|nr:sigma-70 family RNA polymerase sigma factor [Actinomycetota bacterium]